MATKEEAQAKIDEINANLDDIGGDVDGLQAEVATLKQAAIDNAVPPDVIDAINAVAARTKSLADKTPNVTPLPEIETPVEGGTEGASTEGGAG
jgi:multidrug resistance efflux pump